MPEEAVDHDAIGLLVVAAIGETGARELLDVLTLAPNLIAPR